MRFREKLSILCLSLAISACGSDGAPSVLEFMFEKDKGEKDTTVRTPDADGTGETPFSVGEIVRRTVSYPLYEILETSDVSMQQVETIVTHFGKQISRPTSSYPFVYAPDKRTVDLIPPVDPRTLRVTANGNVLPAPSYSFTAATNELTFLTEPPLGAAISITYRLNNPLPAVIAVNGPSSYLSSEAYVDDVQIPDAAYDPLAGEVRFQVAPLDEAVIKMDFVIGAEPVLEYEHGLSAAATQHYVMAHYVSNGASIAVEVSGDFLNLEPGAFRADEALRLIVIDENSMVNSIDIEEYVEPGSLVIENGSDICTSGSLVVLPSSVDLSACEISDTNLLITLSYTTTE